MHPLARTGHWVIPLRRSRYGLNWTWCSKLMRKLKLQSLMLTVSGWMLTNDRSGWGFELRMASEDGNFGKWMDWIPLPGWSPFSSHAGFLRRDHIGQRKSLSLCLSRLPGSPCDQPSTHALSLPASSRHQTNGAVQSRAVNLQAFLLKSTFLPKTLLSGIWAKVMKSWLIQAWLTSVLKTSNSRVGSKSN